MSRIPEDVLEAIRQAVDVTDLIGRYVPLKKAGKGFKGCCPFHQEKTPSFHVWQETGTWKCFGCGKGGNLFGFLMEREGLTFPEAARQLARDAGIEIEPEGPEAAARAGRVARLRELHEWACRLFEGALRSPEGAPAREYFQRRKITGETALRFRLGYSLPGWDHLLRAAREAGYSDDELTEAGLVVRHEAEDGGRAKIYDRFRGRVVFPICDPQGRVIAFGARTLGNDNAKYLNSPETPIYTKGRHLYALHLAKSEMMRSGEGAVMEGYTDVIMAHQCGWPVAVASLGTALTEPQAQRLSRYVKRLWLLYDGDTAGRRAAERAIPSFLPEDIETRVALLPSGGDPADILVEGGLPALRGHLDAAPDAFEHLLAARAEQHDVATVPGRAAAVEDVVSALGGVRDSIRRALYVRRLSDEYGVPEAAIGERLEAIEARQARRDHPPRGRPRRTGIGRPEGQVRGHESEPPPEVYERMAAEQSDGAGQSDGNEQPPPPELPAGPPPPVERLLLEALLGAPDLLAEVGEEGAAIVGHPHCRALLSGLLAYAGDPGRCAGVVARLEDPDVAALAADLIISGEGKNLPQQGRDCLRRLGELRRGRGLHEAFRRAADPAEEAQLLRNLVDFHRQRAGGGEE